MLLKRSDMLLLIAGEQDDFIKEAAVDSVRVHPLSMFR